MKFWQGFLAVIVFIVCLALGAGGGCTVGVLVALSREGVSSSPLGNSLPWVLLVVGAVVGGLLGLVIALRIARPSEEEQR